MGLMIPPSPEFLAWEKEYFSFFVTATVGIALHSYDTWYWWIGQAKMIPTPGTQTLGLFVYFGRQDLYGWVRYVVKVYLAWFIYTMIKKIIQHVDYRRMEKALDQEVPPSRLKVLCDNWQNELDAATKHDMAKDGMLQSPMLLSPPSHSRSPSASSLKSLSNTQRWSTGFDTRNAYSERASPSFDESKKEDYGERSFEGTVMICLQNLQANREISQIWITSLQHQSPASNEPCRKSSAIISLVGNPMTISVLHQFIHIILLLNHLIQLAHF